MPVATGAATYRRRIGAAQRDELVLRIDPGHRRHIGRRAPAHFEMVGPPVGVDHEVGDKIGARWLDEDMHPTAFAPLPLVVSPMIQRTVSPAATGPAPTNCSPS
jgi:hypothetical protein